MNGLTDLFGQVQQALFEALVQPAMFKLGLGSLFEEATTQPAGCSSA